MTNFDFNPPFARPYLRGVIGRQGASVAVDDYADGALKELANELALGLPDAPGNPTPAEKLAHLKATLDLPIYSADKNDKNTLFVRIDEAKSRTPLATLVDDRSLTEACLAVQSYVSKRGDLGFNVPQILQRKTILEYLFLRANVLRGLQAPEAIFELLTKDDGEWRRVHDHVVGKAFWAYKRKKSIALPNAQADDRIIQQLRTRPVPLSEARFTPRMEQLVREFVHGAEEVAIIEHVEKQLGIAKDEYPALIAYIKQANKVSEVIKKDNALYYLPIALAQIKNGDATATSEGDDGEPASGDFSVSYYDEQTAALEFDRTSVEAAAQLFFVMVWGDELGVFEVIDRIASQKDPQLKLAIRHREVAEDLGLYVFDERFRNVDTGKICRRVPRAERAMFYREVFGAGDAPVANDAVVNSDFATLWKVLMMEVKDYIVKVEEKEGQVSRQKVYQAIEDLQLSLSASCSGMAKVAAPIMYREMDFVIRQLLDSPDFTSQLAKDGSPSFMKVIEKVRGIRGLNPLRNKGVFGHRILSTIAGATSALQDDQARFDEFVDTVEAYIVAESQLAGLTPEREGEREEREEREEPAAGWIPPGANGATKPAEEWNF